ncbi:protease SohB [Sediminicurvatus halobius]|uniref:Protease SohB n=1 Tax=Sediminicurvatus halobius TaxID=2182432 RepID=A0A2U2MYK3_9GAMM|nr:protease SohB [Spiribacter halobius]PWG61960.1 protease SohB [Spiribacter halobius]UEX78367.1 protease SohB [Spiribacter halobius]
MELLQDYGLFLAKTVTLLAALGFALAMMANAGRSRSRSREQLEVEPLNRRYRDMARRIDQGLAPRRGRLKGLRERRRERREGRRGEARLPRLFVLDFEGDLRASATEALREEVSAVLATARSDDEVLLRLESPGGTVPGYGLAASQLARLRKRGIRLTVSVDRVAASGGYLMACVADRIVAAPFAVIGSIGVVGQVPNFRGLLKRYDVDFELHTAGAHKRTLTLFGENTDEGRAKFRESLQAVHDLFKTHIARHRPKLDLERVATGEHWLGEQALELGLVDDLGTSDDILLERRERMDLVALRYRRPQPFSRRLALTLESLAARLGLGGGHLEE